MKKQLTQLLQFANLREEEIRVYLLLLKLQQATIPQLSSQNKCSSVTVYRSVKSMINKGLIQVKPINNKQSIYVPLSLQALINKVHAQQRKLDRLVGALKGLDAILPFIDLQNEKTDEELIELKFGAEACRAEYLKFPDVCKDEYFHIGSVENLWKVTGLTYDSAEERNFIHKRLKNGIYARIFNVHSRHVEELMKRDSLEKRTTRLREKLPVTENYLGIAENHTSLFICDPDDPKVLVTKQPELVALHKEQFQTLWQKG